MSLRKSLFLLMPVLMCGGMAQVQAGPRDVVVDAFQKAFSRGSYRAEISTEVRGKPYLTQMDVQWPDRFRMKNPDTEMIILPSGTWMNAGGRWMQMPMNMSQMIEGFSKRSVEQGIADLGEVREIGSEDVRGCASTVYSYRSSGKFMGVESKSDVEVAICGDNGLPVRLTSRDGGNATRIDYDFEADIDIRPPN